MWPRATAIGGVHVYDFPGAWQSRECQARIDPPFFVSRRGRPRVGRRRGAAASEFRYRGGQAESSIRAKVYGKSLTEIKPPADDSKTGSSTPAPSSMSTAARATYATALDDQPYYPKWKALQPTGKDRLFRFDRLSDEYLQQNYQAYIWRRASSTCTSKSDQTSYHGALS